MLKSIVGCCIIIMDTQATTTVIAQAMNIFQIKENLITIIIQNKLTTEATNPIHVVIKVTMSLVEGYTSHVPRPDQYYLLARIPHPTTIWLDISISIDLHDLLYFYFYFIIFSISSLSEDLFYFVCRNN